MKTYNWEGVNPDGYFLDKLEPIPSALPSGLTPSQLYVFMPPNLGDRKSGSAGMPRPISYAVFCLKQKKTSIKPEFDKCGVKIISHTLALGDNHPAPA